MVSENEPFFYKFRHSQLVNDERVGKVTVYMVSASRDIESKPLLPLKVPAL